MRGFTIEESDVLWQGQRLRHSVGCIMIARNHVERDLCIAKFICLLHEMKARSVFAPIPVIQIASNQYKRDFLLNRQRH